MDELVLRASLVGCRFGDVRVINEIDSTNRALLTWAAVGSDDHGRPIADGSVLIARSQTDGRGRLGRRWIAPADSALLMSVLLNTSDLALDRWPLLSFAMGLAVLDAVEASGGPGASTGANLKWPNDVIIDDATSPTGYRKLAGILAESSLPSTGTGHVVVGVGVNLNRPAELDPALGPDAVPTWLGEHVAMPGPETLAAHLLRQFDTYVYILTRSSSDFLESYRSRCRTLGAEVAVDLGERSLVGVATDIDEGGHLVVTDAQMHVHVLSAGDVMHLRPAAPSNSHPVTSPAASAGNFQDQTRQAD